MSQTLHYTVDETFPPERLDKALAEASGFTRTRVQQLIRQGAVAVNGEPGKNNTRLKAGDEIVVAVPENEPYHLEPVAMDLDIRYEDDDVIVINKPRGLIVHPTPTTREATLVQGVLYHCHDLSGINGVNRPGVVHRIDKDTTGLILMAKNDFAHQALAAQLADKTMSRKYLALVNGVIAHNEGTIDAPIGRDPRDRQRMAVTDLNSKPAVTQFFVKERFAEHTLVECHLMTGRTHQIRVHMEYIGHPVVNDPKYAPRRLKGNGQLLHAFELTFIHPRSGRPVTVTAPLPQDFADYLSLLREKEETAHG